MRTENSVKQTLVNSDKKVSKMKLWKPRQEIPAYRGHAFERLESDFVSIMPEMHGTTAFYECGVSLVEAKEGF